MAGSDIYILGISAFYHDSAACLLRNGEVVAAAQEERFTRKKFDESFPSNAINFCLNFVGISLSEVQAVVFYDKPMLKFERLLETYYRHAPTGFISFQKAMPVWLKEKMFIKKLLKDSLKELDPVADPVLKFSEHHLSHAASAFYSAPYQSAAVLTIDGVGEWATASVFKADSTGFRCLKEMHFPHSVGLLYSAFTYFLGFEVNSGEYKLMGLAPYGNSGSEQVERYKELILQNVVTVFEDGSIFLHMPVFSFATGLKMIDERKWEELFDLPVRKKDDNLSQQHADLALAIQQVTDDIVLKLALEARRLTGEENLCLAGGVALNCVSAGRLAEKGVFKQIYTQPAAGDAGGALGAAQAFYFIGLQKSKPDIIAFDHLKGSYLGTAFTNDEIEKVLRKNRLKYVFFEKEAELVQQTAALLDNGNVVGWFQGRMEWGPRALGNRSILADARHPGMQYVLNQKIKHRENFRPFAPAVLAEDAALLFNIEEPEPYMTKIFTVKEELRKPLPPDFKAFDLTEKLKVEKSILPAVTHIDFTARVQTVHPETNLRFYRLLKEFKKLTGLGALINTSFNVNNEPIVESPADAVRCFLNTGMDYLVIGDFVVQKTELNGN